LGEKRKDTFKITTTMLRGNKNACKIERKPRGEMSKYILRIGGGGESDNLRPHIFDLRKNESRGKQGRRNSEIYLWNPSKEKDKSGKRP